MDHIELFFGDLKHRNSALTEILNAPLPDGELERLEYETHVTFPTSLRQLFKHFNGTKAGHWSGLFLGFDPLSAQDAVGHTGGLLQSAVQMEALNCDMTSTQCVPSEASELDFFLPGYFVFAYDGGRAYLAVDHQPGVTGTAGQIITVGQVGSQRYVLARSMNEFFLKLGWLLEAGVLKYSDDEGLHFPGRGNDLIYLLDQGMISF